MVSGFTAAAASRIRSGVTARTSSSRPGMVSLPPAAACPMTKLSMAPAESSVERRLLIRELRAPCSSQSSQRPFFRSSSWALISATARSQFSNSMPEYTVISPFRRWKELLT